jgi:hypothetical protein
LQGFFNFREMESGLSEIDEGRPVSVGGKLTPPPRATGAIGSKPQRAGPSAFTSDMPLALSVPGLKTPQHGGVHRGRSFSGFPSHEGPGAAMGGAQQYPPASAHFHSVDNGVLSHQQHQHQLSHQQHQHPQALHGHGPQPNAVTTPHGTFVYVT